MSISVMTSKLGFFEALVFKEAESKLTKTFVKRKVSTIFMLLPDEPSKNCRTATQSWYAVKKTSCSDCTEIKLFRALVGNINDISYIQYGQNSRNSSILELFFARLPIEEMTDSNQKLACDRFEKSCLSSSAKIRKFNRRGEKKSVLRRKCFYFKWKKGMYL